MRAFQPELSFGPPLGKRASSSRNSPHRHGKHALDMCIRSLRPRHASPSNSPQRAR